MVLVMSDDLPDLGGPCPPGVNPRHWLAATLIDSGLSYKQTGQKLSPPVVEGTVSRYIGQLRARFGPGFLRNDERRTTLTPEARAKGRLIAADLNGTKWTEYRTAASEAYGMGAMVALEAAGEIAAEILGDPMRRQALGVSDVLALGRLSDLYSRRAEALAAPVGGVVGPPAPDVPKSGGALFEGWQPAGMSSSRVAVIRQQVELISETLSAGRDDVVEVTEVAGQ